MNALFHKFARWTSQIVGSAFAFIAALLGIALWAITGPMFGYSDTWQLAINTATTIITFLVVFLIQNTQNRDAKAIHLKLDELIRGVQGARTGLVDLEELSDEELEQLHEEFQRLRRLVGRDRADKRRSKSPAGQRITIPLPNSPSQAAERKGREHGDPTTSRE